MVVWNTRPLPKVPGPGHRPGRPLVLDRGERLDVRHHLELVVELVLDREVLDAARDRARRVDDLDRVLPLLGLTVGLAEMREDAAEHLLPGGQPVLGRIVGAVDRDIAMAGMHELEEGLLLAAGELELGVAAVGVDDDQVVLADGRRLEDRGVLADGHFKPPRVLQDVRQVECLVAVSVVLPPPAREQEDLGAVRARPSGPWPAARTRMTIPGSGRRRRDASRQWLLEGRPAW